MVKLKHLVWIILPILLVGIVGILSNLLERHQDELEPKTDKTDKRKLIISGEFWAPFEYEGKDGELKGIDIEVFKRILPKLGIDYEVRLYPWSRVLLLAKEGEIDFIVSVSYKKSREAFLIYTEDQRAFAEDGKWPENYLWKSEYVFFCKSLYANKIAYDSYEQLKRDGYKIGTVRNYSYNPEFREADLPCYEAPDINTGFKLLADGKYDLFPADKTIGLATIKQLGLEKSITYIDKPLFRKPYLLPACKKSNWPDKLKLMKQFFAELNKLRESGEYKRLTDPYLSQSNKQ